MGKRKRRRLKSGFTTGTSAAAAAKAALIGILNGQAPTEVRVSFLSEGYVDIPVHRFLSHGPEAATCSVIKDAGDDPDVTHGAEIGARVIWSPGSVSETGPVTVRISGGEGVGRVTKPGLEVPPGEAAINPGPKEMIQREIAAVLESRNRTGEVDIQVFVPEGEALARNTLNARLGILGGISILGTTGVVRPMSHDAYVATIRSSLSVAGAAGLERVVFTTGRRSERFAGDLLPTIPPEGFIQIGDFFKVAMEMAHTTGMATVILAVFFGKAVKMAMGTPHTHAAKSALTLDALARWAFSATAKAELRDTIRAANTARHAFESILGRHPEVIDVVGNRMVRSAERFGGGALSVRGIIFDYGGGVCFDSKLPPEAGDHV